MLVTNDDNTLFFSMSALPRSVVDPRIHSANLQRNFLATELAHVFGKYEKFLQIEQLDQRDRYQEDNEILLQILKYHMLVLADTSKGYHVNSSPATEQQFQESKAAVENVFVQKEALETVNIDNASRVASTLQNDICCICLEKFDNAQESCRIKSCNHIFHRVCICAHLARDKHCPVCRKNIADDIWQA